MLALEYVSLKPADVNRSGTAKSTSAAAPKCSILTREGTVLIEFAEADRI